MTELAPLSIGFSWSMFGAVAATEMIQPTTDSAARSATAATTPHASTARPPTLPRPRRLRSCRWRWVIGVRGGSLERFYPAHSATAEDRPALVSLSRQEARSPAAIEPRSDAR